MNGAGSISLLSAEPDFARLLTADEQLRAVSVRLPLRELARGPVDLRTLGGSTAAFLARITDGMLLQTMSLAGREGLRLLGPGDAVCLTPTTAPDLIGNDVLRATVRTKVVIFGEEFMAAARHWPRLLHGLATLAAEGSQRLTAQMLICQLPRVDDRLLVMLWLIAETWGRVTPSGTVLPVRLTHGVLGGLIGARRSTVTLALGQLTERGAIVRQSDGWLLLEAPPAGHPPPAPADSDPRPLAAQPFRWGPDGPDPRTAGRRAHDLGRELSATVARLRSEHVRRSDELEGRLGRLADQRRAAVAARERITSPRPSR